MRKATAALLSLFVGAVLLYLVAPRTIAAFVMLPGNQALRDVQEQRPLADEDLATLAASRERALSWAESGQMWSDLALVQLLEAFAEGAPDRPKAERVEQAIASLKEALRLAPANPYAWTRLAYAEVLTAQPSPEVVAALRMALLTATYEPHLLFPRLELCLIMWRHFELEDRDLVLRQARFAWRADPDRVIQLARRWNRLGVVRAALAASPRDLAKFEKRVQGPGT